MASAAHDNRMEAAESVLDRLVAARPLAARPVLPFTSEVIRDGAALLVRRGPVLVRVRPNNDHARDVARREVSIATMLESFGVSVTPLVEPADQPWIVSGNVVTAWSWIDRSGPTDPYDLGLLARTLRERTSIAAALLPTFEPFGAIAAAVAGMDRTDPEVEFVRQRADELSEVWPGVVVDDPLGRSIVHGDLHPGNVVEGPGGPMLTDLELTGAGGAAFDAAPSVVAVSRYGGDPAKLSDFLKGFGSDPRPWAGFDTYVALYELWVTAWAVGVRGANPVWAREATRRVQTLRDGVDHTWLLS